MSGRGVAPATGAVTPRPAPGADDRILSCLDPLLGRAVESLRRRTGLPSAHPLLRPDRAYLLGLVKPVVAEELALARAHGRLRGQTPEQRFDTFTAGLTAAELFPEYPVLADELTRHLSDWVRVRAGVAERLTADAAEIGDLATLTGADFGRGDPHRGGQSVAVLSWPDGRRIVYKPRSLAVERHFAELIGELAPYLRHPPRPASVVDRGGYGWAEFVAAAPCPDRAAAHRFHWRQGALLAVLHLLRAHDLHAWNVIAAGEHPVYIDLEAILRPRQAGEPPIGSLARAQADSVLTTQILPRWLAETDEHGTHHRDTSGLCGGVGVEGAPVRGVLSYEGEGTDLMRPVPREGWAGPTANRPRFEDGTEVPLDIDAVTGGFEEAYRVLIARRSALTGLLEAFGGDETRAVLRPTRYYAGLLAQARTPEALRDREHRAAVFDDGLRGADSRITRSEHAQLAGGDIPLFHLKASSKALCGPVGVVDGDYAEVPGLDAVLERDLSEADLGRQRWLVRAALATAPGARPGPPRARASAELDESLLLDAACRCADELVATALHDPRDGTVEWWSLHEENGRWVLGATPLGLDSGVCGVALFLAELGAVTGRDDYRELAVETVAGLVDPANAAPESALRAMPISRYRGLGSVVHTAHRLAGLFEVDELWSAARPLADLLFSCAEEATDLTYSAGLAGALPVLAAIHRAPTALAERLARAPVPAGAGVGTGAAGRILALAEIADSAPIGLGPLLDALADAPAGIDWYRGAAGIGSACLAVLGSAAPRPFHDQAERQLSLVLEQIRREPPTDNDSLAHGELGVAEFLLAAGDRELGAGVAVSVARRVLAGTARSAAPTGVWTPGLFAGAAGLGYGLARAARPDQVPGILGLTPSANAPATVSAPG
ncbi:type 2 lantipeptide synthetase LanM family protein [Saccharothrix sp. AJ9571]|nr:type 2 lantipeptide synthetase LanM family protein [Saccharothrix sp. AJ9571]